MPEVTFLSTGTAPDPRVGPCVADPALRPREDGYVVGWVCRGVGAQAEGKSAYSYRPAGADWDEFGPEAQASIVDQWFGGNGRQTAPAMNLDSPYFGYINAVRVAS